MTRRQEFTTRARLKVWDREHGRCEHCRKKLTPGDSPQYDHITPCELGGDNSEDNCQLLCGPCHRFKTAKQDTPAIVRSRKARANFAGAKTRKGPPVPGSKDHWAKRKADGSWVRRDTGEPI